MNDAHRIIDYINRERICREHSWALVKLRTTYSKALLVDSIEGDVWDDAPVWLFEDGSALTESFDPIYQTRATHMGPAYVAPQSENDEDTQ